MPLRPPPPDRLGDRLRRRFRALGAYSGLTHWLLVRGTVLLAALALLYAANGLVNGWTISYDVTIGITSPGDKDILVPALAWPLSVAGWLAAPAVFGAVAGVVISVAITERRRQPISKVLTRQSGPDE